MIAAAGLLAVDDGRRRRSDRGGLLTSARCPVAVVLLYVQVVVVAAAVVGLVERDGQRLGSGELRVDAADRRSLAIVARLLGLEIVVAGRCWLRAVGGR